MQCVTLLLILVDTGFKELYLPLLVTRIHCTMWWVWKHICQSIFSKCQYQWSWDKPYSLGCNHLCPMLQFGSKHVCFEDVHIFKHCHEMTHFLLWIGTYCISRVVQQTSGVKHLSSLVRYYNSCLAAIRHVQCIIPVVRPRPNIRSHSVLLQRESTDDWSKKKNELRKNSSPPTPFNTNARFEIYLQYIWILTNRMFLIS